MLAIGSHRGSSQQILQYCMTLWYRAVASYVTTVNQLYISLLILGYLRYLLRLCGKKSGRLYNAMNSETRAAWNYRYIAIYRYSAVIVLGKSNEYCTEIVS